MMPRPQYKNINSFLPCSFYLMFFATFGAIVAICLFGIISGSIILGTITTIPTKIIDFQNGTAADCMACGFTPNNTCAAYRYECGDKWYWTNMENNNGTGPNPLNYCKYESELICYKYYVLWYSEIDILNPTKICAITITFCLVLGIFICSGIILSIYYDRYVFKTHRPSRV